MDNGAVESLYGDYILEEYMEPYLCLTRKDIEGLNEKSTDLSKDGQILSLK